MVRNLLLSVILHGKSHVQNLYLADVEQFLVLGFAEMLLLLQPEDPGQVFSRTVSEYRSFSVFKHEIHLGVADEDLVDMYSFLAYKPFKSKFCNNVAGFEEGVYLRLGRVRCILCGILVDYHRILEHESREWLEVDLFERNLTVQLL